MGLFAHLFGLHPWDVDRLTVYEFYGYKGWADDWNSKRSSNMDEE